MISVCTKFCSRCKKEKPISEFNKRKSRPDGLQYLCRDCSRAARIEIRNLDLEMSRNKEAEYARANKKAYILRQRKWREANREKTRANTQKWREKNPHKVQEHRHVRRARKYNAPIYLISKKDLRKLKESPCFYCGGPNEHIDHVIPVSRGGSNSIGNLVASCAKCNLSKASSFIIELKWKQK